VASDDNLGASGDAISPQQLAGGAGGARVAEPTVPQPFGHMGTRAGAPPPKGSCPPEELPITEL
jgi:hypothetical protein